MTSTIAQVKADADRLKLALMTHLSVGETGYDDNDIVVALKHAGVKGFNGQFLGFSVLDIDDLVVPANATNGTPEKPLSISDRRLLKALLAFYHYVCRRNGGAVNINMSKKAAFDAFRTQIYDPSANIVPWMIPISTPESENLDKWNRAIRPSSSDYKEFKDESHWIRAKERFTTTIEAHGLPHLIDSKFVVTDPKLDTAQQNWLFKIFQDKMQAPQAKSIVSNHLGDKDTRAIWTELLDHYDHSMTAQLQSYKISGYLTSIRLAHGAWKGTQSGFIAHFKEQARLYNEISDVPFASTQLVNFLHAAVSGVPNLSQVLTLHNTAAHAAGVTKTYSFDEYCAALLDQAQVYDSAQTSSRNPRVQRSVNAHDIQFDHDPSDHSHHYETHTHDIDTSIDQILVHQSDATGTRRDSNPGPRTGPRLVRLNAKTWNSLSTADQVAWDQVSEPGKKAIVDYGRTTATRSQSGRPNQRSINQHEQDPFSDLVFDEDPQEPLEVHTHETGKPTAPSFLTMATQRTERVQTLEEIEDLLSATTPTASNVSHLMDGRCQGLLDRLEARGR